MTTLPEYKYRGARAMILLHERYLTEFVAVWKKAKASGIKLPQTDDSDYQSLDHLLHHLFRAARGYMTWCCEMLGLPDPQIDAAPTPEGAAREADDYLTHLLDKWRTPLADIEEEKFYPGYKSRWGMDYSIDSILEHAVMHPLRHIFQLEELLRNHP